MKSWLSSLFALTVALLCTNCHSTSSPGAPSSTRPTTQFALHLSGTVTDNISRPLAGVQVTVAQPLGVMTTTDANGSFTLSDATLVNASVSLQIVKDGYRPAHLTIRNNSDSVRLIMTPFNLLTLDGAYTVTVSAADSCTDLPSAVRTRTYVATFQPSPNGNTLVVAPLSGADLFPFYNTISASVSNDAAVFYVYSWDADNAWGDDEPIIDRLGSSTYVSFDGRATSSILTSTASIAATFNGTIAYCAASRDPATQNWPLTCATGALMECKSSQHQMMLTRK